MHFYLPKCGLLVEAQEALDELLVVDGLSWNALMAGYARQGESELVFDLFKRMVEEGVQPGEVTFLSVLTVCNHSGLVDKGLNFFEAVSEVHGITPTLEIYNCMIDLLGRAGQLDEVAMLLEKDASST